MNFIGVDVRDFITGKRVCQRTRWPIPSDSCAVKPTVLKLREHGRLTGRSPNTTRAARQLYLPDHENITVYQVKHVRKIIFLSTSWDQDTHRTDWVCFQLQEPARNTSGSGSIKGSSMPSKIHVVIKSWVLHLYLKTLTCLTPSLFLFFLSVWEFPHQTSYNKCRFATTTHWKRLPVSLSSYRRRGLGVCSLSRSRRYGGRAEPWVFYLRVCPEPDPSTSPELLAASWSSADRLPQKTCSGAAGATETGERLRRCFYCFYRSPEAPGGTGSAAGSCSKK